jgi:DNA polymerase-3 subunit gamma/tau
VSHALYRKWRPRTFDQVVGQEHVTQTLRNAVTSSRIAHAYLFSGPRGTGKTSTARILAKAVNCLAEADNRPCNECQMCQAIDQGRAMDLIEIDAASHTGVDDIRDLRDKISFSPAEATYKLYIIDEVHMLSPSAFNALLKTLEEPPAHAILVLATTEPHKIPATVLSRCQRFDFRPISVKATIQRLRDIANEEGLSVHEGALDLIARQSTGSMRDAESLLDQLSSYGGSEITLEQVHTMLGTASSQAVRELVEHLATRDVAAGLSTIGRAIADGADPRQLNKDLIGYLRGLLLVKTTDRGPSDVTEEEQSEMTQRAAHFSLARLVHTIKIFNRAALDVKGSAQPQLPLELALVEAVLSGDPDGADQPWSPPTPEARPAKIAEERTEVKSIEATAPPTATGTVPEAAPQREIPEDRMPRLSQEGAEAGLAGLQKAWNEIAARVNRTNQSIAAIARDCPPVALEGDVLTLCARSPFHKQKLESDQARQLVEQVTAEALGRSCRITCVLSPHEPAQSTDDKDLEQLAEDPLIKAGLELGGQIGTVEQARLTQRDESSPASGGEQPVAGG